MEPQPPIALVVLASVVMVVASIGMATRPGTALGVLRRPQPMLLPMLAMFVLMPLFVLLVTRALPLDIIVRTALLAVMLSPMAPLLPRRAPDTDPRDGQCLHDHSIGLQVAACFTSLLAAPCYVLLIGWLFDRTLTLDSGAMAMALVATVGAPLLTGVLVNRFVPQRAARLRRPLSVMGMGLLAGAVLLLRSWPAMWDAVGYGALLAMPLIAGFCYALGHVLGGPGQERRIALADAWCCATPAWWSCSVAWQSRAGCCLWWARSSFVCLSAP